MLDQCSDLSHDAVSPIEEAVDVDEGETEGRRIKGQRLIDKPTKEEWEDHMRTHIPFRNWCPYCVKGKSKTPPRRTAQTGELGSDEHDKIAKMSMDYMFPRSGGKEGVTKNPTRSLSCRTACLRELLP